VEKPVALCLDIAQRVLEKIEKKDLLTCVGYPLRYGGGTAVTRQLLAGQTIALVVGQYWSGSGREDPRE